MGYWQQLARKSVVTEAVEMPAVLAMADAAIADPRVPAEDGATAIIATMAAEIAQTTPMPITQ